MDTTATSRVYFATNSHVLTYVFTNRELVVCVTDTNANRPSICSRDPVILLMSKRRELAPLTRTRFSQLSDLFHAVARYATAIIRHADASPALLLFQR